MKRSLDDIYGSRWITAAAGSVLYLEGEPGDPIVSLRHLKQPAAEIGPLTLIHDHDAGTTEIFETPDLPDLAGEYGTTVKDAAKVLYETADPSRSEIEKTRRRFERHPGVELVPASNPSLYRRCSR